MAVSKPMEEMEQTPCITEAAVEGVSVFRQGY